jgi:putative transcriptional regulator
MTALLAAALLLASSNEPAIGRFLIAQPQVTGFFGETVILLVDHGDHGSLGLVVNRPMPHSVAELLPSLEGARGHDEPAWWGGPVEPGGVLLLIRASAAPEGSAPVVGDVHVSGSRDTLVTWLGKPPAGGELRAYAGYAGWAPGQLAAELARGDWLVAPADAKSVFTRDPSGLWKKLFEAHRSIRVERPTLAVLRERLLAVAGPAKSINLTAPWRSAAASSGFRTSASRRSSTR